MTHLVQLKFSNRRSAGIPGIALVLIEIEPSVLFCERKVLLRNAVWQCSAIPGSSLPARLFLF